MALQSASDVKVGTIFQSRDALKRLYYVQDIEMSIENGKSFVKNLIVLPIMAADSPSQSGVRQSVPLDLTQIRNRDRSASLPEQLIVGLGPNIILKSSIDSDYMIDIIGQSDAEITEAVEKVYKDIQSSYDRISDLKEKEEEIAIKTADYSGITGPVAGVQLVKHNPLEVASLHAPPLKKVKKKKPKSLVKVPDIYLEDAHAEEFISDDTYKALTQHRDKNEPETLREALFLSQKMDKKPFLKFIEGQTFDEAFPESTRNELDDMIIAEHPAIYALGNIPLSEALDKGLLQNKFTVQALSTQGTTDSDFGDDDFDERQILLLEEAFSLIALDPKFLEEYSRPNNPKNTLTNKQINGITEDIKNAFNLATKQQALEDITADLNKGYSQLKKIFLASEKSTKSKVFLNHDPAIEVANSVKPALEKFQKQITENRPPRLTLFK